MYEAIAISCFVLLFVMTAIWLVLVWWLFRHLREHHAATFEAIGSPSLFWNDSPRNNWLFLRFLFSSQWRALADPAIANAVRFMRRFLIVYVLLFLGVLAIFLSGTIH
jgi:hypothetical protein